MEERKGPTAWAAPAICRWTPPNNLQLHSLVLSKAKLLPSCTSSSLTSSKGAVRPWGFEQSTHGVEWETPGVSTLWGDHQQSVHPRGFVLVCAPAEDAAVFHTGEKKPVPFFLNWGIAFWKSSNWKHAHSSPYNSEIITRLHFCEWTTRCASLQGVWKRRMRWGTWIRSFDVLHYEGLGELSSFPDFPNSSAPMACPALWGEAGENIRCSLGGGSPVTRKIMNNFVLPKAQNQLRGEKESQL